MLSRELQRHGVKCYVLYAPSEAKGKNFFAVCVLGEQLHSNVWAAILESGGGGLERDPEGRSVQ